MGLGDVSKGLYDHLYRRFLEGRVVQQGYDFQRAPSGSAPLPVVTFQARLRWWTWNRWHRRAAILIARDRLQQDILEAKKAVIKIKKNID